MWILPLNVLEMWCLLAIFPHSLIDHLAISVQLTHAMAHILEELSLVIVTIFPNVDTITRFSV